MLEWLMLTQPMQRQLLTLPQRVQARPVQRQVTRHQAQPAAAVAAAVQFAPAGVVVMPAVVAAEGNN
jgi:hypothetical protein